MTDLYACTLPTHPRLGRHVEHDERSRAYPARKAAVAVESVVHKHYGPVLDQGWVGACTGFAATQGLMAAPLRLPNRRLYAKTALALYGRATALDPFPGEYPPDDTGSSGLAVCKAAVEAGYISRYEWAFGIDHARAALSRGPVLVGTAWYEGMNEPNDLGIVRATGELLGGHEYLCLGYVGEDFLFLNSWGKNWGRPSGSNLAAVSGGTFWMSYATFGALLEDQGDVVQPIA
jgi:hypothetical protein